MKGRVIIAWTFGEFNDVTATVAEIEEWAETLGGNVPAPDEFDLTFDGCTVKVTP